MGAGTRIALFGAIATAGSALSLVPVLSGTAWFWQSVGVILVVVGTGELMRRWAGASLLVPIVQAAALIGWMTVFFAREEAVLGILPGPAAWERLQEVLLAGLGDLGRYPLPLPSESPASAVVVLVVGSTAFTVDLFAATLRQVAWAGLPLLTLYAVPSEFAGGAHPLLFVCAGAGFVGLLLAEGRFRFAASGRALVVDPEPTRGRARRWVRGGPPAQADVTARAGHRVAAVVLVVAVAVPATLSGVLAEGLLGEALEGLGENGLGSTPSRPRATPADQLDQANRSHLVVDNPVVSLHRDLNQPRNVPLMRVRSDDPRNRDDYLRATALDRFDGTTWTRSDHDDVRLLPERLPAPEGVREGVARQTRTSRIEIGTNFRARWLPLPQPASEVAVPGTWLLDERSRDIQAAPGQTTAGLAYTVESLALAPTAQQLASAPEPPRDLVERYTWLPDDLPPIVERLGREVTVGAENSYERAVALQEWFTDRRQFTYDLSVKSAWGSDALAEFLRDRRGYCQQFAGTFAVMARQFGIPARVAVGYTPGVTQPDGTNIIGTQDAHAWPELYFEGAGWVRFEPTPTVSGRRGTTPSWARPGNLVGELQDPRTRGRDHSPSPEPTAAVDRRTGTDAGASENAPWSRRLVVVLVVGVVIGGVVAAVPMIARTVVRRHRQARLRAPLGDPAAWARTAWAELAD
ncbi:MAG TPA: DUF3488 and transglutaminase-like domain-containing protein, partial [Actinopolymorphaceae bacterium]